MNSQEFLEFTKKFKGYKDGHFEYIEIYNNEKTGTVMKISKPEFCASDEDGYYIFITEVYNKNLYSRFITDEEELVEDFFEWCKDKEISTEKYDRYDLYQSINFINQKDIDNMIFEDELFNKFYIEKKENYCFYCKFLPLTENYIFNVCAEEFDSYNKALKNYEVIEIYEHLVKNQF